MTKNEFAKVVECEGWEYVLTRVSPHKLKDAGIAEALMDVQEAFKILVEATPEASFDFNEEDEDEDLDELDFDQD